MKADQSHFNVVVVGAGISGIGAGYHLQKQCPNKSFVILEGREIDKKTSDAVFKRTGKIRLIHFNCQFERGESLSQITGST